MSVSGLAQSFERLMQQRRPHVPTTREHTVRTAANQVEDAVLKGQLSRKMSIGMRAARPLNTELHGHVGSGRAIDRIGEIDGIREMGPVGN
jgi:hypothetical protein